VPDDVDDDLAQITLAGAVGDGDGRWWSVEGALLGDQRGDLLQGGRAGQLPELGGDVGDLAGVGDVAGVHPAGRAVDGHLRPLAAVGQPAVVPGGDQAGGERLEPGEGAEVDPRALAHVEDVPGDDADDTEIGPLERDAALDRFTG